MPQLNPSPWFIYLVCTWIAFAIIVPPKIMSYTSPNQLTAQADKTQQKTTWPWQWH